MNEKPNTHRFIFGNRRICSCGGQSMAGKKEEDTVRDMPQVVSTDPHGKEQDLLKGLPLGVGEAKRILAVASQRNNRLKALGNAIVPQVAEEIMTSIKALTR